MDTETFGLTWQSFQGHLASCFHDLLIEKSFSDVILVTDDHTQFKAHKFVLSACSPVLKELLLLNPHPNPWLYLRGVSQQELESILQFMYLGETKIDQNRIDNFLDIAKDFQIKELTQEIASSDDEPENLDAHDETVDMQANMESVQDSFLINQDEDQAGPTNEANEHHLR